MRLQTGIGLNGGLWSDAEAFLDRLDVAAEDPESAPARLIWNLLEANSLTKNFSALQPLDSIKRLRALTRRFVALQCDRTTVSHDEGLESWNAYKSWVERLRKSGDIHTILTFNYDLVLEKLGIDVPVNSQVPHLDAPGNADEQITIEQEMRVYALKLHGSVDWMRDQDGDFVKPSGNWNLQTCDGDTIAIASPGPCKNNCVEGPLSKLWDSGLRAISEADSIVFVGYRFPPSDAVARSKILQAIGRNKKAKQLTLNTVLGPNLTQSDSVRLKALLTYTAHNSDRIDEASDIRSLTASVGTFRLIEHPLWTEDFVTVWEPRLTCSGRY